jgi:predicted CXXCH cytochrome family protein
MGPTMSRSSPRPSSRRAPSRRAAALVATLLLTGMAWAAWPSLRSFIGTRPSTTSRSSRASDPYADTPYRNARPGVAYVGDAACARCHREIAESYRAHPMGRSLAPIGAVDDGPPIGPAAGLPFEAEGVRYTVERRDGRLIHKATRRDADGGILAEVEAEVRYALGSGTRGITYLIECDGFLFQSPIAWFAQERRWDISPGYGGPRPRPNFQRAIQRECLFCHTSRVRSVAGTLNRYETPIFEGHAIGCERCHGPGELHAEWGGGSAGPDPTIVNPARLASALRESVCQQCHLQGWFRFPRADRDSFDYRPGLPLHRFLAVFVRKEGDPDRTELIGQVEQMESSRCFRASGGEMGCISCHDPHRTPPPAARAEYYRGRCLECHEQRGCALPAPERRTRGPGEDCIACHMPRPAVADVPHTVTTNHRIPRVVGTPASKPARPQAAPGVPEEFVPREYHWDLMTKQERREAARDRGVALELAAQALRAAPRLARLSATQAVPLLEAAVRDRPDDLRAGESLGYALGMLDRLEEARQAYEEILRIEPRRESALPYLARTLAALRRPDLATAALREVIEVNPWRSDYRLALARYRADAGDWPGAAAASREALRLNPELCEARPLLIQCGLRSGEPAKADVEFRTLLLFDPAGRDEWRRWYERQKRAGPRDVGFAPNGHP